MAPIDLLDRVAITLPFIKKKKSPQSAIKQNKIKQDILVVRL